MKGSPKPGPKSTAPGRNASPGGALARRVREGLGALVARAGAGAGSLKEKALRRPLLLRQALAARQRGNLEAAFWLLNEEFAQRPDAAAVAAAFWEVARALERPATAAAAARALVEHHALAGESELATRYFAELAESGADEILVAALALARLVPALRRRVDDAAEGEREIARGLLRCALRQAVDPRNTDLTAGLAVRLFEEAREIDPAVARRAAAVALGSPGLHEERRARIRAWLEGVPAGAEGSAPAEPDPAPAAPPPARREMAPGALRVLEAVPLALAQDALHLRLGGGRSTRLAWGEIQAISAVEIAGPDGARTAVIDLVLNWSRRAAEALRVVRLRADAFEPAALVTGASAVGAVGALGALLSELLERSRAVPLPDPESALGLRLAAFDSLDAYEAAALRIAG